MISVTYHPPQSSGAGRHMSQFELASPYSPAGDQPQAIDQLVEGLRRAERTRH